jgi:hypothetical protein
MKKPLFLFLRSRGFLLVVRVVVRRWHRIAPGETLLFRALEAKAFCLPLD